MIELNHLKKLKKMIISNVVNGNVAFFDASGEDERVIQQTGVQLNKTLDDKGVIIQQAGYSNVTVLTEDVTAYQILPAAAVPFS